MRRLMLLRHAKTENDAPTGRDQDRRLDARGRSDAAEIGEWIGRHPPFPDAVVVSPAVRARETWDIAWQAMREHVREPQVHEVPAIYAAEPGDLLTVIRTATIPDNPERLMLVGHNPGMHELALMLSNGADGAAAQALQDNLPTSGLAIFDFDIPDWSDIGFRRGQLVLFVSPKSLRRS